MDYWRQQDIIDTKELRKLVVSLIGCGGIGSPTAIALSKMGVARLHLWDPDIVEEHNLASQYYRIQDIGKKKVDALKEIIGELSDFTTVVCCPRKFANVRMSGIYISGVDSMTARKTIWEKMRYNPNVKAYIDARMGPHSLRIFTILTHNPGDVKWYESTLHSDEESDRDPCTMRSIVYTTFATASLICNQVKRIVCNEPIMQDIILDFASLILPTEKMVTIQ